MDEYERAAGVLKHLVEAIPEDKFVEILDSATRDADCRSVQTIMAHVVGAGYAYADYLRELFSIRPNRPSPQAFRTGNHSRDSMKCLPIPCKL